MSRGPTRPADGTPGGGKRAQAPDEKDGPDGATVGGVEAERGQRDPRTEHPAAGGGETLYVCDLCGHVMLDLHCKLICEQCGYKRDCSDP